MSYRPRWLRIRVTPQVRTLRLAPGDIIVAHTDDKTLTLDALTHIKRNLERQFPDNEAIVTTFDISTIRAGR